MSTETLGGVISRARKGLGLSQKELAQLVQVDDDGRTKAMSPQYLNDIEHDRRSPSSTQLVEQFSKILKLDPEYLFFLADRWPDSLRVSIKSQEEFSKAMTAFRKTTRHG